MYGTSGAKATDSFKKISLMHVLKKVKKKC